MQLDSATHEKLVKALSLLGCQDKDRRAEAAAVIDRFVASLGGWGALLKAPCRSAQRTPNTPPPDTQWRRLPPNKDGCAGSRRRYRGALLTVRECQPPTPGVPHDRSRSWEIKWFAVVNRDPVVYGDGRPQLFATEYQAQYAAQAWAVPDTEPEPAAQVGEAE